jgi:hypothetical protein
VERADRRREIPAAGDDRTAQPRDSGHPDRGVDGLKGFPEALTSVFPRAVVQTRIVHLIRYSMHFAAWQERRPVALALKPTYETASGHGGAGGWKISSAAPRGKNIPPSRRTGGATGSS